MRASEVRVSTFLKKESGLLLERSPAPHPSGEHKRVLAFRTSEVNYRSPSVTVTSPDKSQIMKPVQNFMLFHTALLDSALCDSIALKKGCTPKRGVGRGERIAAFVPRNERIES